jgi:hypothetical protein
LLHPMQGMYIGFIYSNLLKTHDPSVGKVNNSEGNRHCGKSED